MRPIRPPVVERPSRAVRSVEMPSKHPDDLPEVVRIFLNDASSICRASMLGFRTSLCGPSSSGVLIAETSPENHWCLLRFIGGYSSTPKYEAGVKYHSRNSTAAPLVSSMVVKGTLRKPCSATPAERMTYLCGQCRDMPLARAITIPHSNADNGARTGPSEAIPSVANAEALSEPKPYSRARISAIGIS